MDTNRTLGTGLLWLKLLVSTAALCEVAAFAETRPESPDPRPASDLATAFRDPPPEARPRVWWHWINGNITADGLIKDLQWMKRVGIGGVQSFDADLKSPQIVDKRLIYMTPEWKAAFRTAAQTADRLDLELAIASSPGWSETGGPWVAPQDGMKKLVWSETAVMGGRRLSIVLPQPPATIGLYQSITAESGNDSNINDKSPDLPAPYYRDVAVLAFPAPPARPMARPVATDTAGQPINSALLLDDDLRTAVELPKSKNGAATLELAYPTAQTARSVTLFVPDAANQFAGANLRAKLEAQRGDGSWKAVRDIPLTRVPTTIEFAPVTARKFRISFTPSSSLPDFVMPPPGIDLTTLASGFSRPKQSKDILVADLQLTSQTRIDRAEAKAGYDVVRDYYALSQGLDDTPGVNQASVIDITGHMRADGTLDWRAPGGQWRILRLGYSLTGTMNHPAPREATGLEVDKYDAEAVRRYMEHYIAMYRDAAGADMVGQDGVRAILNDSIEVGAANWTPGMIGHFKRLRGYDPTPWLPTLTGTIIGSREESDRFLFDFRRTLADLLADAHYGTVARVAHENGLKVYSEALEDNRPQIGDDLQMRRHADVPMAAMWYFPLGEDPKQTYIADIKGAASVANIYGRPYVAAESMTSMLAPWAYGPRDLKHVIDLEFATGINRPVIHTSVHVPTEDHKPGLRLSIFGQDFNRNEAWAELARPWVDYIARNSLMLQQGRNVADIAYFYGEEAPVTGLYGEKPVSGIPKANAFDFVNADALLEAFRNNGNDLVTSGGAQYRVLYLGGSSHRMSLKVLRKIVALAEGGATVVGLRPQGDPGIVADQAEYDALVNRLWPGTPTTEVGRGRVIATDDLDAALAQAGVAPDFAYAAKQEGSVLPFVHRRLDHGDIYFISNQKDRVETIEARFRVTGKAAELWRAETGTHEQVSYSIRDRETVVPLTLQPGQSVHVVFRKPATGSDVVIHKAALREVATLRGPWKVKFEPGHGAPSDAELPALIPLNEHESPGIKYFSGIATYTRDFQAPRGWKPGHPLILDLGEAREIAEVTVNGKLAGHAWHAPYRVEIGAFVKPGRNRLQVRVANLWVNRLIGDAQPDAEKVTWTASRTYRKDGPLRPSGLIGPLRLLGEERED
ncbi:hypothetical protein GCM10011494_19270 [Novosphingobium endophyticum]|uniref:Glycoside hydrolase n=1 Tax=Novosphingobium endophyticum TaxID=1955250 RepID=A0A916TSI5_9SPHN|nr:glycosyl hydrolase [Novosphingobium endophyticum]GGC00868.1 hypothetical protein GCM10011494_19270 [Novosphingobium endophyticum]